MIIITTFRSAIGRAGGLLARAVRAVLTPLFGTLNWSAPPWVRWVGQRMAAIAAAAAAKPLNAAIALGLVAAVGFGAHSGYKWWKARPKPLEVTMTAQNPPRTPIENEDENDRGPRALVINFNHAVAPLAQVEKEVKEGITIEPALAGTWKWVTDKQLEFAPKEDWPVGATHTVGVAKTVVASHIRLADYNVKFHTPPFVAKVVRGQFYQDPTNPSAKKAVFDNISRIDTPDPFTVILVLNNADGNFPFRMGENTAVILDPKSAATTASHPVGTGPFRFADWKKGSSITLVKNEEWRGAAGVKMKKVVFRFISDPAAQVAALLAGDLDGMPRFTAAQNLSQFQADKRFTVEIGGTEGKTIVSINERRKPFDDLRVRRALAAAIDRKAVIAGAMEGYGAPIIDLFLGGVIPGVLLGISLMIAVWNPAYASSQSVGMSLRVSIRKPVTTRSGGICGTTRSLHKRAWARPNPWLSSASFAAWTIVGWLASPR